LRRDRRQRTRPLARCSACREAFEPSRADAVYCSSACRQFAYRRRLSPARTTARRPCYRPLPAKAHQRVVRERLAGEAPTPPAALDIGKAEVRAISYAAARQVIERFEYLASMPAVARFCFGLFFGEHLGGVVVYAHEPGENLGSWDRYGYEGRIITLARGACLPWAHPHSASKLIRRSMRLLSERFKVVTATVDRDAGEVGTIYQAAGFDYVGTMTAGGRVLVRDHVGRSVSGRQARRRFGTESVHALRSLGIEAMPVARRGRYFAFLGSKVEQRTLRAAVAHLMKPYPKRAPSA